MADPPECRTCPSVKALTNTGCYYAGPIAYTPIRRRGVRSETAYQCIFTCLTTIAVHIEVTTDLSIPSYFSALKRFVVVPLKLCVDNSTNIRI